MTRPGWELPAEEIQQQQEVVPDVYIGLFKISISNASRPEIFRIDSLGVYPTEALFFAQMRAEVSSREERIRTLFLERDITVEKVELRSVAKISARMARGVFNFRGCDLSPLLFPEAQRLT
jgi:hypothetical protein